VTEVLERDPWFEDFADGCSRAAHLYATAFDRMTIELGDATALALAPVVLPQVVAMAEAQASQLEAMRFQRALQQQEREMTEAMQQQIYGRPQQPENPW
jgi:hypothetical protein